MFLYLGGIIIPEEQFINYKLLSRSNQVINGKVNPIDIYEVELDNNTKWRIPLEDETKNILNEVLKKRETKVQKNVDNREEV